MKPVNPGSHRKKVILYYTLAVVLPGMILGYMAYRGIRNDQALRERESRRRLETDSQAFFAVIDASLADYMNEQAPDSLIAKSGPGDPSLLALFVRDSSGSKKLINHKLIYLPQELMSLQPLQKSPPAGLEEGLRLEFIEQKYPEALRFYQDKNLKTDNPAEKTLLLVASARLYNKMNQPERAKDLYNEIRKKYPESLLNGQIPLGLTSGLEILKINKILGETKELSYNSVQFLELLLHPSCEYDENQFDLFYQSFKEITPKTDHVIDSLFREIDSRRAQTDYIIRILNGPDLVVANSNNH
ncbi:MAG: tetratricopeptide repeat protein, partial [Bacteroidia bacterium]|nr:tetratricopeptide repeat protein [Bacteroidia bacterium]